MKCKHSPSCNCQIKTFTLCPEGPTFWSHPFVAGVPFDNFKIPPNLYTLSSLINMTTMIRQNNKFPPTARSPRQTWSPGYSLPQRAVCVILILTQGHWEPAFEPRPFDSECSAVIHFSMSLARKYVYPKEPYNQDIKE